MHEITRRDLMKKSAGVVAGMAAAAAVPGQITAAVHAKRRGRAEPRLRFGVIGMNHFHIYHMVEAVTRGGGELASVFVLEPDLRAAFTRRFPNAHVAADEREILEDDSIQLILSSIIPNERAPLGIRVMQHGKDYIADKPGITTLEQLALVRRVQAETQRIYSIMYSERFESAGTVEAGELVRAGAIGQVIHTLGLGPHQVGLTQRPDWFWNPDAYGGILCDIGSHQVDQFLFFTGSTRGNVVASQIANYRNLEHPGFQDFGEMMLRGDGGTGYVRLDWFTPAGLGVWGDTRIIVEGTDGYLEVRKNIDIAGRDGPEHLFIVDDNSTRHIDCSSVELPYGRQIVDDVVNRTETAMSQAHCFLATELALEAQQQATWVTGAPG
ncbi:MAG: Gfo/Idh/MocA family oxidoreductase [Gemmatimonadota bacterium]|nr:MAG: Gfo/Idh/MocA family oxidoreductase [Gemmatimonadota bacterium]